MNLLLEGYLKPFPWRNSAGAWSSPVLSVYAKITNQSTYTPAFSSLYPFLVYTRNLTFVFYHEQYQNLYPYNDSTIVTDIQRVTSLDRNRYTSVFDDDVASISVCIYHQSVRLIAVQFAAMLRRHRVMFFLWLQRRVLLCSVLLYVMHPRQNAFGSAVS